MRFHFKKITAQHLKNRTKHGRSISNPLTLLGLKYICVFSLFSMLGWHRCQNPYSWMTRTYYMYRQYHGCWWPGFARSQGINNHDLLFLEYSGFSAKRLNLYSGQNQPETSYFWHSTLSAVYQYIEDIRSRILSICFQTTAQQIDF